MNLPTLAAPRDQLDRLAPWLAPLGLRLLLALEFFESGREAARPELVRRPAGRLSIPVRPVAGHPELATGDLVRTARGGLPAVRFRHRFAAASLLVLTVVATYAVHWPMEWNSLADLAMGYAISDQGFGNFAAGAVHGHAAAADLHRRAS